MASWTEGKRVGMRERRTGNGALSNELDRGDTLSVGSRLSESSGRKHVDCVCVFVCYVNEKLACQGVVLSVGPGCKACTKEVGGLAVLSRLWSRWGIINHTKCFCKTNVNGSFR